MEGIMSLYAMYASERSTVKIQKLYAKRENEPQERADSVKLSEMTGRIVFIHTIGWMCDRRGAAAT